MIAQCPAPLLPTKMRTPPILAKTPWKAENKAPSPSPPQRATPHENQSQPQIPRKPLQPEHQKIRNIGVTTPITAPKQLCTAVEFFLAIQKIFNVT